MNKLIGYFYKFIGKTIDITLTVLMSFVSILVEVFSSIKSAIGLLLSMGGCLFFGFLFFPIMFATLLNPVVLTIIFLAVAIPFIGKIANSYLKYIHYISTEYFYDRADYYLLGSSYSFGDFSEYKNKYRIKEEQERIKRQEEARKRQEEQWDEFFSQFGGFTFTFKDFDDFRGFEDFYQNSSEQGGYYNYGNYGQNPQNPMGGFVKNYEDSCRVLEVPTTADKYEIKLQYRKLAKKYHPDINKEPGANERFQKINAAYEFLNDSNIERYKNLKNTH